MTGVDGQVVGDLVVKVLIGAAAVAGLAISILGRRFAGRLQTAASFAGAGFLVVLFVLTAAGRSAPKWALMLAAATIIALSGARVWLAIRRPEHSAWKRSESPEKGPR